MVRTAYAETKLLKYLESFTTTKTCTVGLILGQHCEDNDYILHFAKTPIPTDETHTVITNISDIHELDVADHAKHATRMLPGGMHVLGVFVVTDEDILNPLASKVKTILNYLHKYLGKNQLLYGNNSKSERLILHYSTKTQKHTAKIFNSETGVDSNVQVLFTNNILNWITMECKFEINETVKISDQQDGILPLKVQLKNILSTVNTNLKNAIYLFDGDLKSGSNQIDSKAKKINKSKSNTLTGDEEEKVTHVSILLPTYCKSTVESTKVVNSIGYVKIKGLVSSTVWLNPKTTYSMASKAITEDIVRSLAARFTMHFDSLTEGEHGDLFTDASSIHETPRRVLISIPSQKVMLSDYLFPGEGTQEAELAFQEGLDIIIANKSAIKEVECQADLSEYYNEILEGESLEAIPKMQIDSNKFLYMAGGGFAFVVLIISLLLHFFMH